MHIGSNEPLPLFPAVPDFEYAYVPTQWSLNFNFRNDAYDPRISVVRDGQKAYWGSDGMLHMAGPHEWPVEFDPVTGARLGRSVWRQRTNTFLNSEAILPSNANITSEAGVGTSPRGTETVSRVRETLTTATRAGTYSISVTSGQSYTASIFAREFSPSEKRYLTILFTPAGFGANVRVTVDLATGAFEPISSPSRVEVKNVGGMWHVQMTAVATATASASLQLRLAVQSPDNLVAWEGDGVSGIDWWGCVFENAAFAGPYIPTEGSAVTRPRDLVTIPINGEVLPFGGTIITEWHQNVPAVGNCGAWWLNNGTNLRGLGLYYVSPSNLRFMYRTLDSITRETGNVFIPDDPIIRAACTWTSAMIALSVNGRPPVTVSGESIFAEFNQLNIGEYNASGSNTGPLNMPMSFLRTLPRAVSLDELQAMSAI